MEHPSLKPKNVLEKMEQDMQAVRQKICSVKETAANMEAEFGSLDALKILASIQTDLADFTTKYATVLDKLSANAEAEAEFLSSAKEKIKQF